MNFVFFGLRRFMLRSLVVASLLSVVNVYFFTLEAHASSLSDSDWIQDPTGDDNGYGGLIYPAGIEPGSADISGVRFIVEEENVRVQVKMVHWDVSSRIGLVLLDGKAIQESDYDFTIGGTELRVPYWNDHGLNLIIASPDSELYDYNVKVENPEGQPRPDNAIYIYHDPTLWLGQDGNASKDPQQVQRVEVSVNQVDDGSPSKDWIVSFAIKRSILEQFLNISSAEPHIYAAVMTYFVTTSDATEYGAHEVSSSLGAHDSWEDPDVYDLAFAPSQSEILHPKIDESGLDATSHLSGEGQGFVKIELPWFHR